MDISKAVLSAVAIATALPGAAALAQTAASEAPIALEEVVVTAERREQNLQKVPIAVSVVSAEALAQRGTADIRQLQNTVPGLKILEVGQQPGIFIRGVGAAVANIGQDPAASFNVDGVPLARPLGINAALFDLQRVEVLKGPQGTLYGRNSTAGAVNVLTQRPTRELSGHASIRGGNYGAVQGEVVGNLPVGDTLAFRAGIMINNRDGYISDGSDDADSRSARVRALWEPSEAFSLLGSVAYTKMEGVGPGDVPLDTITGAYINSDSWTLGTNTGSARGVFQDGVTVPGGPRQTTIPANLSTQDLTLKSFSAEASWNLGPVTLTFIPAYIDSDYSTITYNGGFRQVINSTDEQTSFELRLASADEQRLSWIIGAFYMTDDQVANNDVHTQNINLPGVGLTAVRGLSFWPIDLTTYAGFGQATFKVTDRFRVTGGLRYTKDSKESVNNSFQNVTGTGAPLGPRNLGNSDSSWDYTSFRLGVDVDLTDTSLLYANISNAYKAGGDNQGLPTGNAGLASYVPEKLTSYQVGLRNTLVDGRLLLNGETFYWQWDDLQGFGIDCLNVAGTGNQLPTCPLPGTAIAGRTRNFGDAKIYGAEVEMIWALSQNDRVSLSGTYLRTEFGTARAIDRTVLDGRELLRSPKWQGIAGYTHDWNFGSGARLSATVRDQFSTRNAIAQPTATFAGVSEGGWHQLSANLDYLSASGAWSVGLFGENLNEDDHTVFGARTPGGFWGHPTQPRTYGARLRVDF